MTFLVKCCTRSGHYRKWSPLKWPVDSFASDAGLIERAGHPMSLLGQLPATRTYRRVTSGHEGRSSTYPMATTCRHLRLQLVGRHCLTLYQHYSDLNAGHCWPLRVMSGRGWVCCDQMCCCGCAKLFDIGVRPTKTVFLLLPLSLFALWLTRMESRYRQWKWPDRC